MDIDDYLRRLESDLNQRLAAIETEMQFCPNCGCKLEGEMAFCPNCGTKLREDAESEPEQEPGDDLNHPTVALEEYPDLEEDSKAKIGTFVSAANSMMDEMPVYGFANRDYALYVSLLAGVVELECKLSVFRLEHSLHDGRRADITLSEGKTIVLNEDKITLGALLNNLRLDRKLPVGLDAEGIPAKGLIEHLEKIKNVRNDASHGQVISKAGFDAFYTVFYSFYNNLLPLLLCLKKRLRQQTKPTSHHKACSGSASDSQEEPNRQEAMGADARAVRQGILLTNSDRLAIKYYGTVNDRDGNSFSALILQYLKGYIQLSAMAGIDYTLIDMAAPELTGLIDKEFSWQRHLLALDAVAERLGITADNPWGLFIIGGDDVIPMPTVESPLAHLFRPKKINMLEVDVDTDVPYAYRAADVKVQEDGRLSFDTLLLHSNGPRFLVGRLPMESGQMETCFKDDLSAYMAKYLKYFCHVDENGEMPSRRAAGFDLETVQQTCAEVFYAEAQTTQSILGLESEGSIVAGQGPNGPSYVMRNGIYMSPAIDTSRCEDTQSREITDLYTTAISGKDMLIFNTHSGPSNTDDGSSFTGQPQTKEPEYPPTLQPYMMHETTTKVMVPMCCWGARYKKYRRSRSMLLTSMYDSQVLTYMGSSRSAYGSRTASATNAVGMTTFFADYMMQGMTAGEALTHARYDLINSMPDESDAIYVPLTFLEFNLFGDPLIYAQATHPARNMAEVARGGKSCHNAPLTYDKNKEHTVEEYRNEADNTSRSILDRVRSLVNRNLQQIRETVARELYSQYRVEPRHLNSIFSYQNAEGKKTYIFCYSNNDSDVVNQITHAYVSERGEILNVIHSY